MIQPRKGLCVRVHACECTRTCTHSDTHTKKHMHAYICSYTRAHSGEREESRFVLHFCRHLRPRHRSSPPAPLRVPFATSPGTAGGIRTRASSLPLRPGICDTSGYKPFQALAGGFKPLHTVSHSESPSVTQRRLVQGLTQTCRMVLITWTRLHAYGKERRHHYPGTDAKRSVSRKK